ncbi:MAG: glycosyltransferase family 2 protein [Pseudomonadota bacterium]|nr:glycosyltransferase family 2 protein [Pseudomonadota bacterium]
MSGVAAVVVTYHCGERMDRLLPALLPQVQQVYIVDNGSDGVTVQCLQRIAGEYADRVTLLLNMDNLGVAAAQNQGIRKALARHFEWVLLLDDDSIPEPGMVACMLAAWKKSGDKRLGIVAPRLLEEKDNISGHYIIGWGGIFFTRRRLEAGKQLDVAMVIASGSMVRAEVFKTAGLMAEGFFIDSVDHEFCLRARRQGYRILAVGDAVLRHRQGDKQIFRLLGLPVVVSRHNETRRYYMFRNRMFVLRRHAARFPFLLLHEPLACLWDLMRIVGFEENKLSKLKSIVRGLADGMVSRVPQEARL